MSSLAPASAEAALVKRVANGDRGALGELYDAYGPKVLAIGLRILRDRGRAEDLVHEVFLEAWRHASEYDPSRAGVGTWLCLIARSRAVDARRGQTRAEVLTTGVKNEPIDPPADAARTIETKEALEALSCVSPDELQVIVLAYFDGLSSTEIAERVGVPVGTVKSRTRSAFSKLRARLGEQGGTP